MNSKKNLASEKLAHIAELTPINRGLLGKVNVTLDVRLGNTSMTVERLMSLENGTVVTLENSVVDRAELYLDGSLVALGEIVAVGDKFGVRVTDLVTEA